MEKWLIGEMIKNKQDKDKRKIRLGVKIWRTYWKKLWETKDWKSNIERYRKCISSTKRTKSEIN